MNHSQTKCSCSIFSENFTNLKILSIHRILIEIEEFFLKHGNIDALYNFYKDNEFITIKFTFYARIEIVHPSQLKNASVLIQGNINHLLYVLKNFCDLNKMISISVEMLGENHYEYLKLSHENEAADRKYLFAS